MKTKELAKQVRDKVVEKYKSGLVYNDTSETLIIQWSAIKFIITKYTTTSLPREGRPPKLADRTRRAIIREVTKRPKVTLKNLENSTDETDVSIRSTTVSCTLHRLRLYGRVVRKKQFLTKSLLKGMWGAQQTLGRRS